MKRIFPVIIIVSLFAILATGISRFVFADPITYSSRFQTWSNIGDGTSITPGNIEFTDETYGAGYLIAYLTWSSPTSAQVGFTSPPGDFTNDDYQSYTIFADDDGDSETPEIEYIIQSLTFQLSTSDYNDSPSFNFDGFTNSANIIVVGIAGVDSVEVLGSQSGDADNVQFTETSPDSFTLPLGFSTISYPPSKTEAGNDTTRLAQNLGYTGNTSYQDTAFTANDTEVTDTITARFLNGGDEPESTEFIALGYDITLTTDPIGPSVEIDGSPNIVDNDVTINGTAYTRDDDNYFLNEVYYYLNTNGPEIIYSDPEPCNDCSGLHNFSIELTDLAADDYILEIYAAETDNFGNVTTMASPEIVEFTVGVPTPEFPKVTIDSGPTVVGDSVEITGHAESQGGDFYINEIYYYINADGLTYMPAADTVYDEITEEFVLNLEDLDTGNYTLEFYTSETDGNTSNNSEAAGPEIINFEILEQPENPVINVLTGPLSATSSFINLTADVSDANGDVITRIWYTINGGADIEVNPTDGVFDESTENFSIGPVGPYQNGTIVDFVVYVENEIDETDTITYNDLDIQNSSDRATCTLSNHPTPTSDTTPTHTVTCTSTDNISLMEYRYYNFISGEQVAWTEIDSLTSGSYGTNSVTASVNPGLTLDEGNTSLSIRAYTGTGRFQEDSFLPVDVFAIESIDNSAPTIKLNPILPDPISTDSPLITGSCQDTNPFDTNSNIASIQYRIDAGSWLNLPITSGAFDSTIESFSYQLPAQTISEHTIDVRCADSSGMDTNSLGGNKSLTFEVIEQPEVEAEEVVITETFNNNDLNSVNETNLVWGNGYIRLKEVMTFERSNIDTSGYLTRYESAFQSSYPSKKIGSEMWYAKQRSVTRYNPTTSATSSYNNLIPDGSRITDFTYFTSGGKEYLITASPSGLYIHNLTDTTNTLYNAGGLNSLTYTPRNIVADTRDGRLGFFIDNDTINGGPNSNFYYLNLNNTPDNLGDDTYLWYVSGGGINFNNINTALLDSDNNALYLSNYGDGLYKLTDQNTPTDQGDDAFIYYDTSDDLDLDTISSLAFDNDSNDLFVLTQAVYSTLLYIDQGDLPNDKSDDSVIRLADQNDLFLEQGTKLQFVAGPQYIGGQLFINTSRGDLIYYNTNGSYSTDTDDTSLIMRTSEGLYPEFIGGFSVFDYNTIFANFQRSGFSRLDINRSWQDSGQAVTITIPPDVRLIVNNINLEDVELGPLLEDEDGSQQSNSGVGVQYFISLDDGVNYTEVSVGDLNYTLDNDFRLKLKIVLTKIGFNSQTPIVDNFRIAYAAYQDINQSQELSSLEISTPDTDFDVNENFTVTVTAKDSLGYTIQDLNDTVNLQLKYFASSANVSALTPITLDLTNGVGTITTAKINIAGEFKIEAGIDSTTIQTGKLTVTQPAVDPGEDDDDTNVIPTLSFTTDKVTIKKGQSALLMWSSTNLASLSLSGIGNVNLNGNLTVSPTETTTYTLFGVDPDSDTIASSLTIIVTDESIPVSDTTEQLEDTEELNPEIFETGTMLSLNIPKDYIEYYDGEKVKIEWSAKGDPDSVFIDYQNSNVTNEGFFEFYPQGNTTITITAKKGDQIISKKIVVRLIEAQPINAIVPIAIAAAGLLATSFVSGGFFYYLSTFVGIVLFKKKKYWGIIYNSKSMNKIAFATIRVYKKVGTQKIFITQSISNLDGTYGISISESGDYLVEFIHEAYRTELRELSIQKGSDIVLDVGMIGIDTSNLSVFTKIRIFSKEKASEIMQLLRVIVICLMLVGAYQTIQIINVSPSTYNYIVLMLYLAAIFVQTVVIFKPIVENKRGRVIELDTNRPVKGAIFRILYSDLKATYGVENISMTNDLGILKIRIKPGTYNYQVSRAGYATDTGRVKIDESGKISESIFLKKKSETGTSKKFGEV